MKFPGDSGGVVEHSSMGSCSFISNVVGIFIAPIEGIVVPITSIQNNIPSIFFMLCFLPCLFAGHWFVNPCIYLNVWKQ
jgi:hypothetical protein